MLGIEALDLAQLDVGVLSSVYGSSGHPPLSTGQAGGQVRPGPGSMPLAGPARLGDDLAVSWLPQPDVPLLAAKYHGVIPAPHHHIRPPWRLSYGHQMTRRDPFLPRGGELRGVPGQDNLPTGQDPAGVLFYMQHDGTVQSRGSQRVAG